MRRTTFTSACVALTAVLALATGCSSSGADGLFSDDCNTCAPQPVAQNPCAPPAATPCDPAPVAPCAPAPAPAAQGQRPPDARPGEVWCYVRVPAVTRTDSERVCVRPASFREVQVPAKTQQVERRVCVQPASTRQIPIPAEFQTVEERVCVAPGRTEWQKVDCNPSQLSQGEQLGECWTLREIPPQYQTNQKRVCVRPAGCRTEQVPAQFETRMETVVIEPARVDRIPVPAEFETKLREVVVCGPRWEWRRTTECEVPDAAAVAPMPLQEQPLPGPGDAVGSPDGGAIDNAIPPAGGLPELPPLR